MMRRFGLCSTLLGLSWIAFGCGAGDPPTVSVSAEPTTLASGGATTLTVEVTDFELRAPPNTQHSGLVAAQHDHDADGHHDAADGDADYPDGGHYHVYLDSTDVNPLLMAWDSTRQITVTASAGAHRLIVRLNHDDHRFLQPEIKAHVDITIE